MKTMKKIYVTPNMSVVKLKPMQILAGSEGMQGQGNYNSDNVIIGARGFSFDDEEEDEY
jgi:hypothetical protein